MLLLLFRNMLWAAWWPYCTMLLAMEKTAQQERARQAKPQSSPPAGNDARRPQESRMASDAFPKPEIPEPLRDFVKLSIDQARRAFETFAATSEKTWKSFESMPPLGRAGLFALNAKIAEITRQNAEANFALAMKLAEVKDMQQAMELQSRHVKQQMETFAQQLEAMRDLATEIIQEAAPAAQTSTGGAPSAQPPASDAGPSAGGG
jgi:phasin